MIAVIIAGGSGTRLWPLSTPDYPKHLLKIGDDKSLLCNTYERMKSLASSVYIVTEVSHAAHVKDQLPDLPETAFIIEPARRGTANCIIAALAHISQSDKADEAIAFVAADHYIRDKRGFANSFKLASEISEREGRIVLVGVEPDYPSTGLGYIKKDGLFGNEKFVYNVDSFKEKPDHKTAKIFLKTGDYLWNCSYYIGSLKTFKAKMKEYAPSLLRDYETLVSAQGKDDFDDAYKELEPDAIDYALAEKAKDLLVVPASFDWMDLGSYSDIHHAVERDELDNHVTGEQIGLHDVENAYIVNHEDKPVAIIGLDNVAVVNTPHGLLITRKDQAQKVKDVLASINSTAKK